MHHYLDFENEIADLEAKIEELKRSSSSDSKNIGKEIYKLQQNVKESLKKIYKNLNPSQTVKIARHPERPHTKDYIDFMIDDFIELSGDRLYGDDHAIIAGIGRLNGTSVLIMGHEKGHDTVSRMKHNFGSARPEGYRKCQRIMDLADRLSIPVISLVDTAGAYPGVGAEERGQAQAIATSIEKCINIKVPFISVIIGEGGSGGAIGIAVSDKVLMLEYSMYSVISPEGCASILWRETNFANDAAKALKITAADLLKFKIIDEIIEEPLGGAHRDKVTCMTTVKDKLTKHLNNLKNHDGRNLVLMRREKFLEMTTKI